MEPFENISRLISHSDKIKQKKAICTYCNAKASFTIRTVKAEQEVLIGSGDMYQPVCKICYFENSHFLKKL